MRIENQLHAERLGFPLTRSDHVLRNKATSVIWSGNAKRGKALYQRYCIFCHGQYGDGGEKARLILIPNLAILQKLHSNADRRRAEACPWIATCTTPSAAVFMPAECLPGSLDAPGAS